MCLIHILKTITDCHVSHPFLFTLCAQPNVNAVHIPWSVGFTETSMWLNQNWFWYENDEFTATKITNRSMECRLKFSPQTINNALDLLDAAHKMQFINIKSNGKLLSINPWLNCKILLFAPAGEKHFKQKNSLSFNCILIDFLLENALCYLTGLHLLLYGSDSIAALCYHSCGWHVQLAWALHGFSVVLSLTLTLFLALPRSRPSLSAWFYFFANDDPKELHVEEYGNSI